MPAQNSLHCTAQFIFHGHSRHWHCTDHFIFKANDSIRYHKSDTALTVTRNQTTTTACTRSTHDVTSYLMGYMYVDRYFTTVPHIYCSAGYICVLGIWLYFVNNFCCCCRIGHLQGQDLWLCKIWSWSINGKVACINMTHKHTNTHVHILGFYSTCSIDLLFI